MQLFNLHVIRFNMLRGEGGKRQSFLLYYNRTQSTAGLWRIGLSSSQRRMTHLKRFQARRRSCRSGLNCQWHCYQYSCATTKTKLVYRAMPYQASMVRSAGPNQPGLVSFSSEQYLFTQQKIGIPHRAIVNHIMPSCQCKCATGHLHIQKLLYATLVHDSTKYS